MFRFGLAVVISLFFILSFRFRCGIIRVVSILAAIFCNFFLAFNIIYGITIRFRRLILCSILFVPSLGPLASLGRFLFAIFRCLKCGFSCGSAKFHA